MALVLLTANLALTFGAVLPEQLKVVPVLEKILISTAPVPIAIIILHHINNHYCESANQGDCFVDNSFFPNDPLWDGQQCDNEGTCCNVANTPPWFSVDLGNTTSDDIEVRICHDQDTTDEDTPIQLLEIYVQ